MNKYHTRLVKMLGAVAVLCALAAFAAADSPSDSDTVTVFAAASMTNSLTEIGKTFAEKGLGKVVTSFASSSTLAKQIEKGAPAHIFISADEEWMNYLADRNLIDAATRFDLAGNRLVLIAPANSALNLEIGPGFALLKALGGGRLAVGDPDHVPAGRYAKAALEKLGVWKDIEPRLARAADVRGSLALVERDEVDLGIVYSTDAAISTKVRVVATFPSDSHAPVVYPAAVVSGRDSPAARRFMAFLREADAIAILTRYGFTRP